MKNTTVSHLPGKFLSKKDSVPDRIDIDLYADEAPGAENITFPNLPFEYRHPRLSVLLPPPERRTGTMVLIIPGGGYMYCSYEGPEGFGAAKFFTDRGICAAVLQYRRNMFRKPDGSLELIYRENVALADAERAMQLLRARASSCWKIQHDRIGALGFSAGGHIACCMAVHAGEHTENMQLARIPDAARPDFLVLAYSLISMAPPWSGEIWRSNLLGKEFSPAAAHYYSCQNYVSAKFPPAFLMVADDDFTVHDMEEFDRALNGKHCAHEFLRLNRGGHGFGLGSVDAAATDGPASWPRHLEDFLKKQNLL